MARTDSRFAIPFGVSIVAALAVAGCGGGGSSSPAPVVSQPAPPGSGLGTASVRFINGTPDHSSPTGGTISISGASGPPLADVPYSIVTRYFSFAAGLQAAFVFRSSQWTAPLSCTTPYALTQGGSYTVVVAGASNQSGNQGLQCQVFFENYAAGPSGQGQILFHHASPAAYFSGQPTLQFGLFTPAPQNPGGTQPPFTLSAPLGSAAFTTALLANTAAGVVVSSTFAAVSTGGVGFYVVPPPTPTPVPTATPAPPPAGATPSPTSTPIPTPTPEATLYPMNAQLGAGNPGSLPDPTNAFPVGTSTTLSIYVIDDLPGRSLPFQLVGVID